MKIWCSRAYRVGTWKLRNANVPRYLQHSTPTKISPLVAAKPFRGVTDESVYGENITSRTKPEPCPLALLGLRTLLRSYLISIVSANSRLLAPSLQFLSLLVHSPSPLLQVERNLALRAVLKRTLYAHFCAGQTPSEVRSTIVGLKNIGLDGAILSYAKELIPDNRSTIKQDSSGEEKDVKLWKEGMLETVRLAQGNGHAALKFSGAGPSVTRQLLDNKPPSAIIGQATDAICDYAISKGVNLFFDAEQHAIQSGIDRWTLGLQRKYNRSGSAVVYGTYQAYLRSTPAKLAEHLATAHSEGFALGVKLVRGAYMASDPRHLFWSKKEETDRAFDGLAESLIRRQRNETLTATGRERGLLGGFPRISLNLATHNHESVRKALDIQQEQIHIGDETIELSFAQLMGMADELSCELIAAGQTSHGGDKARIHAPLVYKYVVWGTVQECLTYLLRRAEENRDALVRAKQDRRALGKQLRQRLLGR
ncbi:MAG: hypothetical protein Q9218_000373 [Villophora microphyllina]